MTEVAFPMVVWAPLAALGGLLGFFFAVLLFRSACDLCAVEPPGWPRSAAVVLLIALVSAALGYAFRLGGSALATSLGLSSESTLVLALLASLPFSALLAAPLYMLLLRVRFFQGAMIWLLQTLLSALVGGLAFLLVVGVLTIVEGLRRAL